MSLPTTRTVVVADDNHGAVLTTLPVIPPGPNELLVKIAYAALNPVDWKLLATATAPGSVLVKDYSGTVIAVGPDTPSWSVGDRISGIAMGGLLPLPSGGAATYATVEADLAWHVPDSISLAEATTLSLANTTAALLLYYDIGAPNPPTKVEGEPWLVASGGSTQVGLFLIQWAKLSGYRVVATSSEGNFDLLKKYGADMVVSYGDRAAAVTAIKPLQAAVVAELAGGSSWELSRAVTAKGKYVSVLEDPRGQAMRTNYGKAFKPNAFYDPKVREWTTEFYQKLPKFVESGEIKPAPVTVLDGLELLPQGLKDLKDGKVSGSKLVFRVAGE